MHPEKLGEAIVIYIFVTEVVQDALITKELC